MHTQHMIPTRPHRWLIAGQGDMHTHSTWSLPTRPHRWLIAGQGDIQHMIPDYRWHRETLHAPYCIFITCRSEESAVSPPVSLNCLFPAAKSNAVSVWILASRMQREGRSLGLSKSGRAFVDVRLLGIEIVSPGYSSSRCRRLSAGILARASRAWAPSWTVKIETLSVQTSIYVNPSLLGVLLCRSRRQPLIDFAV